MSSEVRQKAPVPAVAAVIIEDGKLLLVRRAAEPSKDKWSIPGGSVEWGEPLVEALKREVREETGLEIEVGQVAGVFDLIIRDERDKPRRHYVIIDFLSRAAGGTLRAGDDAAEVQWVPVENLDTYELSDLLQARLKKMGVL